MQGKLTLLFVGAVLGAQPPADFEASVKAAMAPSIARQRVSIQKQAALTTPPAAPAGSHSPGSSFFTTPFALTEASAPDCDPLPADQLDPLIKAAAEKSGVDAKLVQAVVDRESAGRPCALSAKGAEGLMQLMPEAAQELEVDDPFDPQQNVEAGAKLLRSLLDRYNNDPSLALSAYNAGSGRVDQAEGIPAIPETADYVTAILEKLGLQRSKTDSGPAASTNYLMIGKRPMAPLKDF
jgi:soluble lytic murein transglycosylase-like protein